jgi:3-hydroxyacyl-CoA dehydrogenase
MSEFVLSSTQNSVRVLRVNNPPVNTLSPGVPEAIVAAIDTAEAEAGISALVVMGAGRTFVAGADIRTLERAAWGDLHEVLDLHGLLARIENCSKPVVMAIHGTALGGGLELAMAGHFRIAVADAVLGQPEVNLGIIPGADGTQRLPRLVGIEKALELCVTGKPLKADAALDAGLIDALVEAGAGELQRRAVELAHDAARRGDWRKTSSRNARLGSDLVNPPLFGWARDLARRIRPHQIAPLNAIAAVEAAATLPFAEGCRRERELFFECVQTEQAKALIHVFFAERAATKTPDAASGAVAAPIEQVAIVGAGTMGTGIATACANAGIPVFLTDTTPAALEAGAAAIAKTYQSSVTRGRMTATAAEARRALIRLDTGTDNLDTADLIIEAVFESMAVKTTVFRELDAVAKPGCVLATNTSTLDIDVIAAATSRPESVVGLHFFSPAHVMRLVEIVRGRDTASATLATAVAFAKRLGKIPVVVGNCPGFVGNRMMFPYMYEAQFMVEEGTTPEQVDHALTTFGMAMGIFAVDDMAGLDVAWRVRQELGHFREPGVRRPLVQDKLVELGRLGQKTGRGWYQYRDDRKAIADPDVVALIRTSSAESGIPQRLFTPDDIVDRAIYALVNEGARVVEEGFAPSAAAIDVIYVNGYGFPAWRGGPMFFADRTGLPVVLERVRAFHREFGDRWTPAPLLVELAEAGRTFRDFDAGRRP